MKRVILTALSLVFAAAAYGAFAAPCFAEDKVVATVNGKSITETDLKVAESEVGADMGTMPEAQKRMSLLEFLIDNQLFADAAEAAKLDQGEDYQKRLNYLKSRALRELYFEKIVKTSISEADARKIYDEQVKLLKPEEEISARHILVDTEEEAKALKKQLDGGADFAELAKEHSKDPGSKDDGGNLGYFGHGQMVPQFEAAAFKLKKGEVSDPVKTQFGWHLIKLEDRRTKQPPAFSVVKDRIMQSLLLHKAQQSAAELRSNAKIDVVDPEIKKAVEERSKAATQPPSGTQPPQEDGAKPQ
jgi:peptidyl-prolyl cis-trans isomerase C